MIARLRRILQIMLLCAISLLLPSKAMSVDLTDEEKDWIEKNPSWRAVGSSSPPQQWIDENGKYRGIAADYDELIADKLGMKVSAVYAPSWPDSVEQLKNGEVDVCTLLIPAPDREEYLNFTTQVTQLQTAILVRNHTNNLKSMADLKGHSVAVPEAWAIELNLRRDYPELDLRPYETLDEAVLAVSTGQADAYAGDIASTTYAIDQLGVTNLKVAFLLPYTLDLAIGVRKDWPEFVPILNKAIEAITPEEHDTIRKRWMAIREEGVSLAEVLRIVVPIVAILTFIGLLIYVTSLRREIHLRRAAQQEVISTRNATIVALAALAETRDSDTGAHLHRTQAYVKALAEELRRRGKYQDQLSDMQIDLLYDTAPLHDVGKVGIPDSILHKSGRLTPEEFAIMQTHTTLGAQALGRAGRDNSAFLNSAAEIALTHHERWDGSGYPRGLKGEEIPLGGRIMAVADVYDALISKRCYKEAIDHKEVVEIIRAEGGRQFDPAVVEAFLAIENQLFEISQTLSDGESSAHLPG